MRARRTAVVLAGICLVMQAVVVWSRADEKKHAIDVWMEKAIEKDSTSAGMRKAAYEAERKWDQEMNKAYRELRRRLNSRQRAALTRSQKAWLSYRDAEFKTIREIVATRQGTIYRELAAGDRLQIVRERALELKYYLDMAKGVV